MTIPCAHRPGRQLLALLAATWLVVGCAPDATSGPLPPEARPVGIDILEDGLLYEGPVPAGRVVFRISNTDDQPHELRLMLLAEGTPSFEEQLEDPPEGRPVLVARVPLLQPGETGMFAARLAEGQRYALADLSDAADGSLHAQSGVAAEFRAGEVSGGGTS